MSQPAAPAISPRLWLAVLGVLGTAAVGFVTFLLGLIALGTLLVNYGGWKNGVDQHLATQDTRIVEVTTACKDMVTNATDGLRKSIEDIEHDRKDHITAADSWRANESATVTKLDTIVTNQQRQIDLLTDANTRRPNKP